MSERKPIDPEEFQDPLENFEPKEYSDELERALAEEPVTSIQSQPYTVIAEDTPVYAALETLAGRDIASTLIVDKQQRLVGIFSDRDILDRVALEYDAVQDKPVSEVMSKNPIRVCDDDSPAAAICVMAAVGYRHVPVVDGEGKLVGMISPKRVVEFLHEHFE